MTEAAAFCFISEKILLSFHYHACRQTSNKVEYWLYKVIEWQQEICSCLCKEPNETRQKVLHLLRDQTTVTNLLFFLYLVLTIKLPWLSILSQWQSNLKLPRIKRQKRTISASLRSRLKTPATKPWSTSVNKNLVFPFSQWIIFGNVISIN